MKIELLWWKINNNIFNYEKKIKEINNRFTCWGIYEINIKGVFLIGRYSKAIKNIKIIIINVSKKIKDAHKDIILKI